MTTGGTVQGSFLNSTPATNFGKAKDFAGRVRYHSTIMNAFSRRLGAFLVCSFHLVLVASAQEQTWPRAFVKRTDAHTFRVLPRRWVVERTFGWLGRSRRLNRDYERQAQTGETMVYLAMIRLMLVRSAGK